MIGRKNEGSYGLPSIRFGHIKRNPFRPACERPPVVVTAAAAAARATAHRIDFRMIFSSTFTALKRTGRVATDPSAAANLLHAIPLNALHRCVLTSGAEN
jgi:hypothetical protein